MPTYDKLKKFLQRQEGYSDQVYADTKGNPTVGYGSNLKSPEVERHLNSMGVDKQALESGDETLSLEQAELLKQKQIEDKKQFLENIRKTSFPNAQIDPNEHDALMSMSYNSPQLIGPQLRQMLDANKKDDVTKEIMLRSNKDKDPGLQKRRLEEAKLYSGENFDNITQNMKPEEIQEIRSIIEGIKNLHERNRVLEEYPFLQDIVPFRPYKRLFNK